MIEVRSYIPTELNDNLMKRSNDLGISKSEYIRLLVTLDISTQRYQKFVTYTNMLFDQISNIQSKLDIYSAPIQGCIITNTENCE